MTMKILAAICSLFLVAAVTVVACGGPEKQKVSETEFSTYESVSKSLQTTQLMVSNRSWEWYKVSFQIRTA